MFFRIKSLLIKEFIQLWRDPRLMNVLIIAPIIQLLILGYAADIDVKNISISIRDYDHSYLSREFIRAISATDYFTATDLVRSQSGDDSLLIGAQTEIVLIIPADFAKNILQGKSTAVQALVDGSDSNTGIQGINHLQKLVMQFNSQFLSKLTLHSKPVVPKIPSLNIKSRVWFNPDLKSRYFMVPAIMALLLIVTTMLIASMALVKEREEGTFEQLIITPAKPLEIIFGKLLPFILIGFLEMTLALPMMLFLFDVPFKGNLPLLYLFSAFFLLSTLGLGLLISMLVNTQQQAMLVATFFVIVPFSLLSGFAFPVENMPRPIQFISDFIPMTYYLVAVRGLFLKAAGWNELMPEAIKLLLWGISIFGISLIHFRRRFE